MAIRLYKVRWCPKCRALVADEDYPHWDYETQHADEEE